MLTNAVVTAVHDDVTPTSIWAAKKAGRLARPDRKGQLGVGSDLSAGWRAATAPLPDVQ